MTEDNPGSGSSSGGGPRRGGGGGGGIGGSIIGALLPLLLRNPKLFIPVLLIGGAAWFFLGRSGGGDNSMMSALVKGCSMDERVYDEAEVFEPLADNAKNPLPEAVTLEKYCPTRLDQGQQGSCVAWASAYGARTILEARETGQNPNSVAFSPSFLYNQIALENCQGSYIIRAMEKMQKEGAAPFNSFPYDETSCSKEPGAAEKQQAAQFKTKGFNRLSKDGDDYRVNMLAIKQNLAQGAPVVIGMMVGGSFMQDMMGKNFWRPTESDYDMAGFGGHAMSVIGYDDNLEGGSFQLMNSWGENWGNKGLAWVSYKDFDYFCKEAYGLYPMGTAEKQNADKLEVEIALYNTGSKTYLPFKVKDGNLMQTVSPIKKGDKFKAEVTNTVECYVYIFGQETDGSSYVLFPYTKKHSPYCGITGTRQFPKDYSMTADDKGNKDVIAVLVTKQPVDYNIVNSAINKASGATYRDKVNNALRNDLVQNVRFSSGEGINFSTPLNEKNAVAVVLEIDKQ